MERGGKNVPAAWDPDSGDVRMARELARAPWREHPSWRGCTNVGNGGGLGLRRREGAKSLRVGGGGCGSRCGCDCRNGFSWQQCGLSCNNAAVRQDNLLRERPVTANTKFTNPPLILLTPRVKSRVVCPVSGFKDSSVATRVLLRPDDLGAQEALAGQSVGTTEAEALVLIVGRQCRQAGVDERHGRDEHRPVG